VDWVDLLLSGCLFLVVVFDIGEDVDVVVVVFALVGSVRLLLNI